MEKWSILEVVNHLYDEERDDFRNQLDITLHSPESEWPPVDPPRRAVEKKYNERSLQLSLQNFLQERQESLRWLRQLNNPDWDIVHNHPKIGAIKARDLLAAWITHDLVHIRQITNLQIEFNSFTAQPFSTRYAMP